MNFKLHHGQLSNDVLVGLSPEQRLALEVLRGAVKDYAKGKKHKHYCEEEWFYSGEYEYWCGLFGVDGWVIREALGFPEPKTKQNPKAMARILEKRLQEFLGRE